MVVLQLYEHELLNTLLSYDFHFYGNLLFHLNRGFSVDDFIDKGYKIQAYAPMGARAYLERHVFENLKVRERQETSSILVCDKMVYTIQHKREGKKKPQMVHLQVFYVFLNENQLFTKDCHYLHDSLYLSRETLGLRHMPEILDACPNPLARIMSMQDFYLFQSPLPRQNVRELLYDKIHYLYAENITNYHTAAKKDKCKADSNKCAICLQKNTEDKSMTLSCQHSFHIKCFRNMVLLSLESSENSNLPSCPLCRKQIRVEEY